MTTALELRRTLKFVSTWTLANAVAVASVVWLAVLLINHKSVPLGLSLLTTFLSFGLAALTQQLVLRRYGLPAPFWWLTSYLGCGAGALPCVFAVDVFVRLIDDWTPFSAYRFAIANVSAACAFGLFFGEVQSLACKQLRQQVLTWPLANGFAFSAVVLIGRCWTLPAKSIDAYLLPLVLGAAYGIITGLTLATMIQRPAPDEPKS